MDIIAKIRKITMEPIALYECWMCGASENSAVAYLWHINTCEKESIFAISH